jgi:hypothetical protein
MDAIDGFGFNTARDRSRIIESTSDAVRRARLQG